MVVLKIDKKWLDLLPEALVELVFSAFEHLGLLKVTHALPAAAAVLC